MTIIIIAIFETVAALILIGVLLSIYFDRREEPVEIVRYVDRIPSDGLVLSRFRCGAVIRPILNRDLADRAIPENENKLERFGILVCSKGCPAFEHCPWVKSLITEGSRDIELVGRIKREPFDHVEWNLADVLNVQQDGDCRLSRKITLLGFETSESPNFGTVFPQRFPVEGNGYPTSDDRHDRGNAGEDGGEQV